MAENNEFLIALDWWRSVEQRTGVKLVCGYDANKIKKMFLAIGGEDPETAGRVAVLGALSLYLDFVNLFLYLLRLFGRRR